MAQACRWAIFRRFAHDPKNPHSISHNTVKAICEDARGRLWIATEGGLNRFDPRTGLFDSYRNSISDPGGLSHDYLLSVLADRSGNLWIGAFNGVNRLELARKPFHAYRQKNEPGHLSSDAVWSVYRDRDGVLWVGTDGGGLNRLDPATGRFSSWMSDPADPSSLSDNAVQCIQEDDGDKFKDEAAYLYEKAVVFRDRFLDPIARIDRGRLPDPIIGFDNMRNYKVLAGYLVRRDAVGLDCRINFNAQHYIEEDD